LFEKFFDALLHRKKPDVPPAPTEPITFPPFAPTDTQKTNMLRIVELVLMSPPKYSQEYPVELIELYRELGMFGEALDLLSRISVVNKDTLTNLLYKLAIEKTNAPIRYRH
jgi:hypothetical protein